MSLLSRGFAEAILVTTLPRTPISAVLLFLFGGAMLSCHYGLETMARVARTSLTFILAGLVILFLAVVETMEISFLFPLYSREPSYIFFQGLTEYSLVSEGLLAAVIILSVSGGWQKFRNATMLAIIFGGMLLLITCMAILLVFGVPSSNELLIPFLISVA
nr:GerAB/ArcD/ProY family transporter [Desulforamulus aquiferis]